MERLKGKDYPYLVDSVILALNEHQIYTARDFINCDSQKLAKISFLLFKEILEIKKMILEKHSAISQPGYNCYKDLFNNTALIPCGIDSIDDFLEGGLLTSNIYEICGKAASGKSLLAYIFMKNLIMNMKQNCIILDSKNDFSAKQFLSLCTEYPHQELMDGLAKIAIKVVIDKYDLMKSFHEIIEMLDKNKTVLRLVVIDSLTAVLTNHTNHSKNNFFLTHLVNMMHFIATKYHIVILVVNLMTTWVEGDFSVQNEIKQNISCGRFWYTVPNTRIKIEKEDTDFKLSVEKSNILVPKAIVVPFTNIIRAQ